MISELTKTEEKITDVSVINKNFVIRIKYDESEKTQLVGAGQYEKHVGATYKEKHFNKVLQTGSQKYDFRVRGKLTAIFISR